MNTYIIVTLIAPFFDRCHIYVISVYLPLYLSTYLPTYLPVFIYLFYLSTHLSYLSTHLIYLSLSVYLSYLSIYIVYLPIYLLIVVVSDFLWPLGLQHTRLPCPSPSPKVCSNSYPLSRWCHPTILSSVTPFSSCPQSFPASGSFSVSQLKLWANYWSFSFSISPTYPTYLSTYLSYLPTYLSIYPPTYILSLSINIIIFP